MTRACARCKATFEAGYSTSYCRPCFRAYYKMDRARNPEKYRARDKRAQARKTKEQGLRVRLKYLYGITPEQKQALLDSQGGICAICKTDQPGKLGWQLDHCHTTDIIRGVLCGNCNKMLGLAKDNIETLREGTAYLS